MWNENTFIYSYDIIDTLTLHVLYIYPQFKSILQLRFSLSQGELNCIKFVFVKLGDSFTTKTPVSFLETLHMESDYFCSEIL